MRPAHQAREVAATLGGKESNKHASMRPAHQAREVKHLVVGGTPTDQRFNEARASSTGSSAKVLLTAKADGASMRPAHQAREVSNRRWGASMGCRASMRPAHQAREVPPIPNPLRGRRRSFNEARASSTGSTTNTEPFAGEASQLQ